MFKNHLKFFIKPVLLGSFSLCYVDIASSSQVVYGVQNAKHFTGNTPSQPNNTLRKKTTPFKPQITNQAIGT
ncbi:hypothetical protein [Legionella norrlandica]|uniref:hypothetical protein n=1 Tax=Legionella norrlandica TaxID=1498499 RepID=UPI001F4CBC8B|nr:hypothetical protein [Legionella norrlandica]